MLRFPTNSSPVLLLALLAAVAVSPTAPCAAFTSAIDLSVSVGLQHATGTTDTPLQLSSGGTTALAAGTVGVGDGYGFSLGASAYVAGGSDDTSPGGDATATVDATDRLLLSTHEYAGTDFLLYTRIEIDLDGEIYATPPDDPFVDLAAAALHATATFTTQSDDEQRLRVTDRVTLSTVIDDPFPYAPQLEIILSPELTRAWQKRRGDLNLQLSANATAGNRNTASAEFGHTLRVASISFLDSEGNLVPGFQVVGESGAQYPVVPAPGAFWLLGSAFAALAARRRSARS